MLKGLARGLLASKRSKIVDRAKSGDPFSIGLVALFLLFRLAKRRSAGKSYTTKLLPGQTITISNIPKSSKKKK